MSARATWTTAFTPTTYLLAARALRDFGDGFVAVLLPVYLLALGFSPLEVGIVATAALLGSALLTIAVGFLGARYDHRQLLLAAASLMVATGVAFALVHDYALLLVVAFAGTINPSGGSVSVSLRARLWLALLRPTSSGSVPVLKISTMSVVLSPMSRGSRVSFSAMTSLMRRTE